MDEERGERRALNRDLERAVQDLTVQMRDLNEVLVRQDVYARDQHFTASTIVGVERANEANRQLIEKYEQSRATEAQALRLLVERLDERRTADILTNRDAVDKIEEKRAADQKAVEDRRYADRRLVLTALVVPFILFLLNVYVSSQGGR